MRKEKDNATKRLRQVGEKGRRPEALKCNLDFAAQNCYILDGADAPQKNALNLHKGGPTGSFPLFYTGTSTIIIRRPAG